MAATLREYLVSLGAEVDQKSFNKFKAALSGSAKTVSTVSGVLAALTVALVKTSISLDDTTQKYEAMAKKAQKTTDEIRAQETALKVLGKTMNDVKADKHLKEQYKELVKLGKTISLPGATAGVLRLRKIIKTVNELRLMASYAMQYVNHYMLNRIKGPLDDLQKGINKFKKNLKNNMPSWTKKVGEFFGDFLRLVLAGVRGVQDLFTNIKKLPEGIKEIGKVIATTFAVSKMGGLAFLLGGLYQLLLLLDDYQTYKRGGLSYYNDLWASFDAGNAAQYIQEAIKKHIDEFVQTGTEICGKIRDGIVSYDWAKGGTDLGTIFHNLFTMLAGILDGKSQHSVFRLVDSVGTIVATICDKLKEGIANFDWSQAGVDLGLIFTNLFTSLMGILDGTSGSGEFNLIKSAGSLVSTIFTKISEGISSFITSVEWGNMLSDAISAGGSFLENIFGAIFGDKEGKTPEELGLAASIGASLKKIIGSIGKAIGRIPFENLGEKSAEIVNGIVLGILDIVNGKNTSIVDFGGVTLNTVTKLFEGIAGAIGTFLGSTEWGKMLEGALGAGSNFMLNVFDLLFGTGAENATDSERGLAGSIEGSLQKIIKGLTEGIKKISPERLGMKTGELITTIFQKFGQLFKPDGNGVSPLMAVLGEGFTLIQTAADSIMDFLLSALSFVKFDAVSDSLNEAISSVLNLIITGLYKGVLELTGEGEKEGLASKMLDFLRNLLFGIGAAIRLINFDQVGEQIGTFVSGLFDKIGTFLSKEGEKAANGDSLLGNLATVLGSIATGIVTLLSSAVQNIKPKDVRTFADGFWSAISGALEDLARRLTSEGEDKIDLPGIGEGIGQAIGGAISIGLDFLIQFAKDALEWVKGGGYETLAEIGKSIAVAIVNGIGSMFSESFMKLLLGEEGYEQYKKEKNSTVTAQVGDDNSVTLTDSTGNEQTLSFDTPEEAQAFAENAEKQKTVFNAFDNKAASGLNLADRENYLVLPEVYSEEGLNTWQKYGNQHSFINTKFGQDAATKMFQAIDTYMYDNGIADASDARNDEESAVIKALDVWSGQAEGDKSEAYATMLQFAQSHSQELQLEIMTVGSQLETASSNASSALGAFATSVNSAAAAANTAASRFSSANPTKSEKQAHGGFFGKPTPVVVGDDGEEAIIPMTNPSRAKGLLQQMFARMGSASRDILASLGATSGGPGIGGPGMPASMQPAAMFPASGGGTITSNSGNTVSAPTTINVYGSGDPLAAGNAAAKASENNIVRRVRGCFE